MTASFVYLIFGTVFNAQIIEYLESYYLFFPIGVAAIAWMISLAFVVMKKFKVPVIVELEGEKS